MILELYHYMHGLQVKGMGQVSNNHGDDSRTQGYTWPQSPYARYSKDSPLQPVEKCVSQLCDCSHAELRSTISFLNPGSSPLLFFAALASLALCNSMPIFFSKRSRLLVSRSSVCIQQQQDSNLSCLLSLYVQWDFSAPEGMVFTSANCWMELIVRAVAAADGWVEAFPLLTLPPPSEPRPKIFLNIFKQERLDLSRCLWNIQVITYRRYLQLLICVLWSWVQKSSRWEGSTARRLPIFATFFSKCRLRVFVKTF